MSHRGGTKKLTDRFTDDAGFRERVMRHPEEEFGKNASKLAHKMEAHPLPPTL